MRARDRVSWCAASVAFVLVAASAHAQSSARTFRAGAAKVDFTPEQSELLTATDSIRDHLFVRAIVVDDGSTCAVLADVDGTVPDTLSDSEGPAPRTLMDDAIARASAATKCPAKNFIVVSTHSHSGTEATNRTLKPEAYVPRHRKLADAIVNAVETAKSHLAPARVVYGTTKLDLNVNRDHFNGKFEWREEPNPEGPSDKTLAVVAFIGADDVPIGVFMNYPMHPINFFLSGVISADFPGDAGRYIEELFDNRTVAVFTQGASGDQDPKLFLSPSTLFVERGFLPKPGQFNETVGPHPSLWELPGGGERKAVPAENLAAYRKFIANTNEYVHTLGTQIGMSAVQVIREASVPTELARIWGERETISCPGRERVEVPGQSREGPATYKDGPDVNIQVGLLRIGDINFANVNGEVYNNIGARLKAQSPASKTIMVTLANSNFDRLAGHPFTSYIYSDDAFSHLTFQVAGSRLKPGCAEGKIVSKALELMHRSGE
jgi:hypothetical protein